MHSLLKHAEAPLPVTCDRRPITAEDIRKAIQFHERRRAEMLRQPLIVCGTEKTVAAKMMTTIEHVRQMLADGRIVFAEKLPVT